ncbi:MAG: 4Fe-4S binding protein [Nitrospirae bacterium]|nr:4Fe-4S binding protein [Nitrospirota bacterium]
MKGRRLTLLIVFLLSLFSGYAIKKISPEQKVDESLYLKEVSPDTEFLKKEDTYYPSREGIIAFNTYDVMPSIRGYAGPIKVLVSLSPEGKIYGIKLLEHKETPNYVHSMETPEFLGQFLGKDINDPFEEDKDIMGISRATVSVSALLSAVRKSSRAIASSVMGIEVIEEVKPKGTNIKWIIYLVLFLLSLGSYFITRLSNRLLRLRDLSLILSIVVIGIYLSSPFSILHVFNLLLLRTSTDTLWYAIVISSLFSILIAGRFYCGWLCPFGAISEFIGRLPLRKWEIPPKIDDRWRNTKYLLLWLIIVSVFVTGRPEFGNYETYVTLFSFHGNILTWSLVGISLLLSLRVKRLWCRYLCPVSALTGVLSRKDKGYISTKDCPMANKPNPLISECIRCNRCYRLD